MCVCLCVFSNVSLHTIASVVCVHVCVCRMGVLPPLILPGGGRFENSVFVSICLNQSTAEGMVVRWRFSMNPTLRSDNGPSFEGRIPARESTPFEEGYQFAPQGKMGYRAKGTKTYNFEFSVPGIYRVYAWIEEEATGEAKSSTQFCAFEVTPPAPTRGC